MPWTSKDMDTLALLKGTVCVLLSNKLNHEFSSVLQLTLCALSMLVPLRILNELYNYVFFVILRKPNFRPTLNT